mmetsp:Transcript_3935/g.10817  ORF Transcript_3935/g.10817 Transcript_3935/m.10817 type:complete len:94 (-) Transcript_3935:19-300(-)|eukprot:CAMPEP_0185843122 /NCGR_PEP_ID=MMETSP1353-20130828/18754_1 /TAXON_ID=1077150 /ORGANISM="Erythrolobus australicus, Strain CCMP3124" /LENGTH=93 /DNA_ID=CAMNT_0028542635 /DNA_START=90 /DNA_END=371 /DNA_ORIENTATION=-
MSRAAKAGLAASFVGFAGVVAYVHWDQKAQQRRMQLGVVRDQERVQYRTAKSISGDVSAIGEGIGGVRRGLEACEICDLKPSPALKATLEDDE